jgi:16S rRNA (guanine527-N7)-methyltransferase
MSITLAEGVAALGVDPAPALLVKLEGFLDLIERWNRSYNLTAVRRRQDMVSQHLLDSLSVAGALQGARVLDVGSGAGLPGVPLAIARPATHFVLLDGNAKRVRFLREVRRSLQLDNVEVVQERVQHYAPGLLFERVIARAFSSLGDFVDNAGRLCAVDGRLLAMKGPRYLSELGALPDGYRLEQVQSLRVPGLDAERNLLIVAHSAPKQWVSQ